MVNGEKMAFLHARKIKYFVLSFKQASCIKLYTYVSRKMLKTKGYTRCVSL